MIPSVTFPAQGAGMQTQRDEMLMQKSKALETAFLSEMLAFTGLGEVSEGFGGGAGEEQFASFLRQEQARLIVERGGIGLAEQIFDSLKSRGGAENDKA